MPDIVRTLMIGAALESAFRAVTAQDELTRWWANGVTAEPKVGSVAEFRFDNGEAVRVEIVELEFGRKVHWRVTRAPHPQWEGTSITWDITPVSGGTDLLFGHHGFVADAAGYGYEETRAGWEYFLGSLKSYLETGKGTPYAREGESP